MSTLTLSFKGKRLKVYPVGDNRVVVGSAPDCTIQIDSLAVDPHHATIRATADGAILRDEDSESGTYVNGQPVKERSLGDGDVVGIGKHTLTFSYDPAPAPAEEAEPAEPEPPPAPEVERPKHAWLQILSGHNVGKTIALNRQLTNLGKPGVQMAVIAHRNEGYFLSHLEGEHPPQVDGEAIGNESRKLGDGDIIQIGNVRMQFYLQ